jgi:hypothetical protein
MDTVLGFPAAVKRNPARFGVTGPVDDAVASLDEALEEALKKRAFSYVNSNGKEVPLTLKDVADRAKLFEMAYNPNDCIEIRWAAPNDSTERSSCHMRAPKHQTAKMTRYRTWFATRKRPPR